RPQRQRGVAQLHRELDILHEIQPQAAPLLWNRVPEQTHVLGMVTQVVGYSVVGQDLLLAWDYDVAHEVTGLSQDRLEIFVGDFGDFDSVHRRCFLFGRRWPVRILYEI